MSYVNEYHDVVNLKYRTGLYRFSTDLNGMDNLLAIFI